MRGSLRENCIFNELNPGVCGIYYVFAIGLTMFSNSPVFLGISMVMAFVFAIYLRGFRAMVPSIGLAAVLVAVTMVINGLFTHRGSTILGYVGGGSITLEAIIYGAVMALMIAAVIIWFSSFNTVVTEDKLVYIFGKIAPTFGLVISMILRFVPMLKERYLEIAAGQKSLGRSWEIKRTPGIKGFFSWVYRRIRQTLKQVSILISWSLESSLVTADSMAARGYGLKGRSSYHLYKIRKSDGLFLGLTLVLGGFCITGFVLGAGRLDYYPIIRYMKPELSGWVNGLTYVAYGVLMALPMLTEGFGSAKRRLK